MVVWSVLPNYYIGVPELTCSFFLFRLGRNVSAGLARYPQIEGI